MMKLTFNGELAKKAGVNGAVMIEELNKLIKVEYESEREKNLHVKYADGRLWVKATASELSETLTFWSSRKIARVLQKLEDEGHIYSTHLSDVEYDRSKWYSVVEDYSC